MNWLKRVANAGSSSYDFTGPHADVDQIVELIQKTTEIVVGIDWACELMQNIDPRLQPQACELIKAQTEAQVTNPGASDILRSLSAAANCPNNPENPPIDQQQNQEVDPSMMPMIGQQEQPMEMPSTEIE